MERPKHLADGVKQGGTAALLGVATGLASLVALPVQGAKEHGARGAATGAVKGVGAFIGLSALGVGAGLVQVVRGGLSTPEAIKAKLTGKEWDKRLHRWIIYNLREEAEIVLNLNEMQYLEYVTSHGETLSAPDAAGAEGAGAAAGGGGSPSAAGGGAGRGRPVKERELYDALNVPTDATSGQIKKAYYKMAREYHPDKNPGDESAKERFQAISNAYQVLSDEDLRAKYDRGGKSGLEDGPKMDAKAFYTMMFGSDEFEPLVGKMNVLSMMGVDEEEPKQAPAGLPEEIFEQARVELTAWKREVTCALNLVDLLEPYVSGDADDTAFRAKLETHGAELSSSSVGAALLGVIGYCYKTQALRQLGDSKVSGGIVERCKGAGAHAGDRVHTAKNYAAVASAGIRAATTAQAIEGKEDGGDKEPNPEQELLKAKATTKAIEAMWHTTVIEIESLLKRVCKKVTHDTSVSKELRRKRAHALIIAGECFAACSSKAGFGAAMEELMQKLGGAVAPDA